MPLCLYPLLAASAPALAEPADYVGQVLAQVSLESPEGALSDEDLSALLRSVQGGVYDPAAVRADLRMLHAVGAYEAVEAHVEPWVDYGPDGELLPAVRLVYQVWPAPILGRVHLTGNRSLKTPELLQAAGLREGARFFPDELQRVEDALGAYYEEQGFAEAAISLESEEGEGGRWTLEIRISEGAPDLLGAIVLVPSDVAIPERRRLVGRDAEALTRSRRELLRMARRAGLRPGRRYTLDGVRALRRSVEQALRRDGWRRARVYSELQAGAEGDTLRLLISAGQRVVVRSEGRHLPRGQAMEELLGVDRERQFSPAWAEEAAARVREDLRRRGWLEAEASVDVEERGGLLLLIVRAERGRRFRLARRGLIIEGNEALDDHTLIEALEQASPEVIGRRRATAEAVEQALGELEDLYRSRGYLGARLSLADFAAEGRWLRVHVAVSEGRQTTLSALRVSGAVEALEDRVEAARAELEGQPINPAAVQRLVRELTEAHRALGYLGADVESRTTLDEAGAGAAVTITVRAGEQQRLRNVVVRGLRRTRRELVEGEVPIEVGDAITPEALAAIRGALYDYEIFSAVSTELTGDDTRARDLLITVRERPATALELGGGVSTDQGVRALGRATRRNLFGLGHSLQGLGQVGLGYAGDTWLPETTSLEWRAALRYEAPNLPGPSRRTIADVLLNEQQLQPTYRLRSSGAGLGVATDLGAAGSVVLDYRVRWRRLEDVDPGALVYGDPWLDILGVQDPAAEALDLPSALRRQAGPSLLMLADSRDDRFNPTRGSSFSVRLDIWDRLLSDTAGGKALGAASLVQPVGPLSLHWRGQLGAGWAAEQGVTLPVDERFRLGGARTLRGYSEDSVGPKNKVSNQELPWPSALGELADYLGRDDPNRWVPTGGDAVAQASAELWLPLRLLGVDTSSSAVIFADVGNVFFLTPGVYADAQPCSYLDPLVQSGAAACPIFAPSPGDDTREPALRYGLGVGLRYPTPVGPLQLDIGINPLYSTSSWAAERGEVLSRFHLSLGSL